MTAEVTRKSSGRSRFVLRAFFECVGWFAGLGAVYLPLATLTFIGLSSRVDSGEWNTIDDPMIFAPALALVGLVGGVVLGVVSGVVVAVSLGSSSSPSEQRLRSVAALSAGSVVLVMTGVVTMYILGSPSDALIWELMVRPVWVLFSCLVPTAVAAALVYGRAPRWAVTSSAADAL